MSDEKCGSKHFWDMESGYCVGCGEVFSTWFDNQKEPREKWKSNIKCECGCDKVYGDTGVHSSWCPKAK